MKMFLPEAAVRMNNSIPPTLGPAVPTMGPQTDAEGFGAGHELRW